MIEDRSVYGYLCSHTPGFTRRSVRNTEAPFEVFDEAAKYTDDLIRQDDEKGLRDFFAIVARIYGRCSNVVRIAIENVFLYHLGTNIEASANRQELLRLVPERLREVVVRQCNAQGI